MRKVPKTVEEVMTRRIITIGEDDKITNVREHMKRFRFRHLPVVRGDKLVGLITHRDMLQISSTPFSKQREVRDMVIHHLPAKSVMQTEVATVTKDTTLVEAGELMASMKVGCLCVTNEDDTLIGIITEADYLQLAIRLVRGLSSAPPSKPPPA